LLEPVDEAMLELALAGSDDAKQDGLQDAAGLASDEESA
jgi:hypothetical protein